MSGTGRRPRINPLLAGFGAGVLIAIVVGLMATINLQYGAPWAASHTVTAQVSDADSMSVGSDVRIAGRLVGQVTSVQEVGSHANIIFHVDDSDWPLAVDTTASVRLATLLGQKYIQLNPGHSSHAMGDGATIGLQSTKPVVDFDQILNTFDGKTRGALTSLIRTGAAAFKGQEGTIQQLIPALRDLSVHSNVPTQELVTRNSEINNILVNLGVTADQLNASSNDLAGVIDNLNSVNGALAADEGAALKAFISNTDTLNITTNAVLSSGFAAQLGSGLQKVGTFATYLNTLVSEILPETASFTQPVAGAEASDFVNGNAAIPARSAIDLIYEIGDASSQGYGFHNFGTSSSPNIQGNFFLRQLQAPDLDPCEFSGNPAAPPANLDPDNDGDSGSWDTDNDGDSAGCTWGQTGTTAGAVAGPVAPAPKASTQAHAAPQVAPSGTAPSSQLPQPTPPACSSACPTPSPSASTTPVPTPGPTPGGPPATPGPTLGGGPATPAPTPNYPSSQFAGIDLPFDNIILDFWDGLFPSRYR